MQRKLKLDIIVKPKTYNMIIYRYKVKEILQQKSAWINVTYKNIRPNKPYKNIYGLFLIILLIQILKRKSNIWCWNSIVRKLPVGGSVGCDGQGHLAGSVGPDNIS